MQKLCKKCLYMGNATEQTTSDKILIVLSVLLVFVFIGLGFWHPLFILGAYLFLLLIVSAIENNYIPSTKCLKCEDNALIPVKSQEAQNIILTNNLDLVDSPVSIVDIIAGYKSLGERKRQICTSCYSIEKKTAQTGCNLTWGLGFFITGLISIPFAFFSPYFLIISFFFVILGIPITLFCFMEPDRCSTCRDRSLIHINSPEGRKIIEEQKLTDSAPIIDEFTGSKLYMFHENFGLIYIVILWLLFAFVFYKLYGFFSSI